MNTHPYLRAYMAGIAFPTMFLLVVVTGFAIARFGFDVPIPVERAIAFPMAVVPNLWGLWNMLYVRQHSRRWPSIGVHGALLVPLIAPLGFVLAKLVLPPLSISAALALPLFGIAIVAYYLVWKLAVGYFNNVLGIA